LTECTGNDEAVGWVSTHVQLIGITLTAAGTYKSSMMGWLAGRAASASTLATIDKSTFYNAV
jgi:hypothetical protein